MQFCSEEFILSLTYPCPNFSEQRDLFNQEEPDTWQTVALDSVWAALVWWNHAGTQGLGGQRGHRGWPSCGWPCLIAASPSPRLSPCRRPARLPPAASPQPPSADFPVLAFSVGTTVICELFLSRQVCPFWLSLCTWLTSRSPPTLMAERPCWRLFLHRAECMFCSFLLFMQFSLPQAAFSFQFVFSFQLFVLIHGVYVFETV